MRSMSNFELSLTSDPESGRLFGAFHRRQKLPYIVLPRNKVPVYRSFTTD